VMRPARPDDPLDGPIFPPTAVIRTALHAAAGTEKPIRVVDDGALVGVVDRSSILESIAGADPDVDLGSTRAGGGTAAHHDPPIEVEPVNEPMDGTARLFAETLAEGVDPTDRP
jgi:hypothetical protein